MSPAADDLLTTLEALTASLSSTLTSLPLTTESDSIAPPKNGISLLDVKNDVLLSYLHNLVFLALMRLKSAPIAGHPAVDDLVKLRLLLERGVKPLEQKLKYQIDKVVVAAAAKADEEEAAIKAATKSSKRGATDSSGEDTEGEANDDEDDISDISDSEGSVQDGNASLRRALLAAATTSDPTDLAHRPNPSSLLLNPSKTAKSAHTDEGDGLYKPPRIAATSMPEVTTAARERKERAAPRNFALEDFIGDELSVAPLPVPSVGTTIVQQGRAHKTSRDRKTELERQTFEESNLVRLPKISKKDAQAARKQTRGARENAFGGEDWRSFAGDLDKLTKSAGRSGVLDKSRKRGGDEGEGRGIGKHYEGRKGMAAKRRKV